MRTVIITLFIIFFSLVSNAQNKDIDKIIKKYSILLNAERKNDGGWNNKMIYDVLLEIYPDKMEGYPSKITIDFFLNKCENLDTDYKMQEGIWNSYRKYGLNASYLKMFFIEMGLSSNEAESLSKYIENKKYKQNKN